MEGFNKRALGSVYEDAAAEYLAGRGYRILERNYRNRFGEVDLIAKKGEWLCFVEVKYRSSTHFGWSSEAVDRRKQQTIMKLAKYYIIKHPWSQECFIRFDVAAFMEDGKLVYYKGAFGGM